MANVATDLYLLRAAERRHTRVHASLSMNDRLCTACLQATREAAEDLRIDLVWQSLDGLFDVIRESKRTKTQPPSARDV